MNCTQSLLPETSAAALPSLFLSSAEQMALCIIGRGVYITVSDTGHSVDAAALHRHCLTDSLEPFWSARFCLKNACRDA